ncbi:hypothetical protein M902_0893 [Bacteriovorax sp. BAL6_X]|uniref:hypothetical protein n=1 Tax=Bacteriovorax sp. BAL6_X TaxID=1201290 RepID=UPI000385C369|nr:hypothetical protein [Bacteriovorax sp. BAL6_X]EPZ49228.1 hypothetical protein M902_0893 [Bacteriovorax sp. BAL6_X]
MKRLFLLTILIASSVSAQIWPLPTGTTYFVKGTGYDCGEFIKRYKVEYTTTPKLFSEKGINFDLLTADSDLNVFSIETSWNTESGQHCQFGLFFNRARETRTLDLDYTKSKSNGSAQACLENEMLIKSKLQSAKYEASKRGIRYIAVDILNEENEVCDGTRVRLIFDRRAQ